MNDLLSRKFSSVLSYANLRKDNLDLEAGAVARETEMADVDPNNRKFQEAVGLVDQELDQVKRLLTDLQRANDESKTAIRSDDMKALRRRMDATIDQVLGSAKRLKALLQELDQANLANRSIPGCGQGSSADRMRTSQMVRLRSRSKTLMDEFYAVRERITAEYRETVERRYFTVTGQHADAATIDSMIDSGQSETFLQRAVQEQGRGQILDTVREIQERHETVKEIERSLLGLHQIFRDMQVLVEAQGEQLNDIQGNVNNATSFVRRGVGALADAKKYQSRSRKWKCIAILILLIVILIIIVPILVKFIPSSS